MYHFHFNYKHEISPADNNMISLYVSVEFEHRELLDILDIDAFFTALKCSGYYPIFTCDCGSFGCGGYYVGVVHKDDGVILKNAYSPFPDIDTHRVIDEFEFHIDWEDVCFICDQLIDKIEEIKERSPGFKVCCGTYGIDIVSKLDIYIRAVSLIRQKFDL